MKEEKKYFFSIGAIIMIVVIAFFASNDTFFTDRDVAGQAIILNPAPMVLRDSDDDCLTNLNERRIGTNQFNPDSDADTYNDGIEVAFGSDPLDPRSGLAFAVVDADADGMLDGWEQYYGLDATYDDSGKDNDNDGKTNKEEYLVGTCPV